ncbi:hypothetical protein PAMP_001067 [Pampus punctatissimus]
MLLYDMVCGNIPFRKVEDILRGKIDFTCKIFTEGADWLVSEPAAFSPANPRADPPPPLGDWQQQSAERQHHLSCYYS